MRCTVPARLLLIGILALRTVSVHAEPPTARLLGGAFDATVASEGVVLIQGRVNDSNFFCSGVVIAPKYVLTAAHCIPSGVIIGGYQVSFSSGTRSVVAAERHPEYREEEFVTSSNIGKDVGVLELSDVAPVQPMSIGVNFPISAGSQLTVAGYGTHPTFGSGGPRGVAAAQSGLAVVTGAGDGFFQTTKFAGSTAVCAGDSGGPAYLRSGGQTFLMGVVSAGTSQNLRSGDCVPSGPNGDSSAYVDVRSSIALPFIARVSGVTLVSVPNVLLNQEIQLLREAVRTVKSLRKLKTVARTEIGILRRVGTLPLDDQRRVSVAKIVRALNKIVKAKDLLAAKKALRSIRNPSEALLSLGV